MIENINNIKEIEQFILKYFPNFSITNDPFEKCYIYKIKNKNIGFISYSIIYERAELNYIVVSEDYRLKGIGQKLLNFCIEDLKKNKVKAISLEVNKNNKAVNFYLKNNFKIEAIRKQYYGKEDAYLMIKKVI